MQDPLLDEVLLRKGRDVSLRGLLDQGPVSLRLAEDQQARLSRFGFGPPLTAELAGLIARLDTDQAKAVDARAGSKTNRTTEQAALTAVKAWKRQLLSAVDDLVADGAAERADREAFEAGGPLGRSTPRHVAWMVKVAGVVQRLGERLSPLLDGVAVAERHDGLRAALQEAQTVQEVALSGLPLETRQVYAAKGRLLSLIEKLNRAGVRAHPGDALAAARFNKDLILRAIRKEKEQPAAPDEAGQGPVQQGPVQQGPAQKA